MGEADCVVTFLPVSPQPLIYVPSHCDVDVAFRGRHQDADGNGLDVFGGDLVKREMSGI